MTPEAAEEEAPEQADGADLLTRFQTAAIQQVADITFPMTRKNVLKVAGHRLIEVEGVEHDITVNMLVSKIRGDNWRTGQDFHKAIERAWDDIRENYL